MIMGPSKSIYPCIPLYNPVIVSTLNPKPETDLNLKRNPGWVSSVSWHGLHNTSLVALAAGHVRRRIWGLGFGV